MTTINKFEKLIKELRSLKNVSQEVVRDKLMDFNKLISELKSQKNRVIEKRIESIKNLVSHYDSAIKVSSFELMEHNFRENSHSNVLQYIFDYKLLGIDAVSILSDFILKFPDLRNKEQLSQKICKMNYYVEREKSVPGGRIDLYISDNVNKFIIIIENKLLSNLIDKTQDDNIEKTQLDNYLTYANNYPSSYDKAFILLSYKKFEKKYKPFLNEDYNYLYNLVLKERVIEDNIFRDYKLLLHSIYSNNDKLNLKRELFNINHNQDLLNINLSNIEDLKKEFKWQKTNLTD